MKAAIRVEALKLRRSPVGVIGTAAVLAGPVLLLCGITAAVASGNAEVAAKAGAGATLDWHGLLASAAQITAAGGLLGFGVVLAWMFGREFTDGTITGLFALPIGRGRIALAKLTVYATWAGTVGVILALCLLALGLLLGYHAPDADALAGLCRQLALTALTAAAAVPVAWFATVARSLLAGVGGAIALVVAGEVGALAGAGGWLPVAAPALWALSDGTAVTAIQLALACAFSAVFAVLACAAWHRLRLDR